MSLGKANYESVTKQVQYGRQQYYNPLLETRPSLPVQHVHFGWPQPYKIPYRKSHTAGMLNAAPYLLEFPEELYPRTQLNPTKGFSTDAVWIRGYGENM